MSVSNNISSRCSQFWPRHNTAQTSAEFGIYSGVMVFCLVGIIGNLVNVLVLRRRNLTAPTYTYLAFLAVLQACSLSMHLLRFFDMINGHDFILNPSWSIAYIIWPIGSYTATTSLIFTVCFTIDRYVYLVIKQKRGSSIGSTQKEQKKARVVSWLLCLVIGIVNMPRMIAFSVDDEAGCTIDRWSTAPGSWFHVYTAVRFGLYNMGTVVLLIVFNSLLIGRVVSSFKLQENVARASSVTSATMFGDPRRSRTNKSRRNAKSLTLALIITVSMVLLGEIPIMLFNPLMNVLWQSLAIDLELVHSLSQLGLFLMLLENSGTFFIYVLVDAKYRQELYRLFYPANQVTEQALLQAAVTGNNCRGSAQKNDTALILN